MFFEEQAKVISFNAHVFISLFFLDVLNEMERNLRDAMCVVRNIILNPFAVPGGGAAEMHLAKEINAAAASVTGVEQFPFR